jgi:DNA helicase-2/ATP-dependent DNA helicase PcrA
MVSDPGLAGEIGGRFDHILVDEYQDTSRLQASILLALKPSGCGLTVRMERPTLPVPNYYRP